MNILDILVSVNKISLGAFVLTFCALAYEIYLLKKENKKNEMLKIPKFEASELKTVKNTTKIMPVKKDEIKLSKPDYKIIFIVVIFLFAFGVITLVGMINFKKQVNTSVPTPTMIFNLVASKGIKALDENFNLLNEIQLSTLKPGAKIIVGVETISGSDVDRARIRINKQNWDISDITTRFDKRYDLFYIEYKVPEGQMRLKIEAQLHSAKEGWLGD